MQIVNDIAACNRYLSPLEQIQARSGLPHCLHASAVTFAAGKSASTGASSASFACFCLSASFGSEPRFRSNSRDDSFGAWNALKVSSFAMMPFSLDEQQASEQCQAV